MSDEKAPTPAKTPEVRNEIQKQTALCVDVRDMLGDLCSRLQGVLRNEPSGDESRGELEALCPLAVDIRDNTLVLQEARTTLKDIFNRLEM